MPLGLCNAPATGKIATCRAKVPCATLDLPAKAKVLNFNGRFGCIVRKQERKVMRAGKGRTRAYQYLEHTAMNSGESL